jgi:hypothetical protein
MYPPKNGGRKQIATIKAARTMNRRNPYLRESWPAMRVTLLESAKITGVVQQHLRLIRLEVQKPKQDTLSTRGTILRQMMKISARVASPN